MYSYALSLADTASDMDSRRMLRRGGAGSNIPEGLSSRRPVLSFHCHVERPTGVETSVYIPCYGFLHSLRSVGMTVMTRQIFRKDTIHASWTSLHPSPKKEADLLGSASFWNIAGTLERSLDLFDSVCLNNVTNLDVIVSLDIKTTVHTHVNLLDIVLETFE